MILSGFTYTGPPPPIISNFSPKSGGEGAVITIEGANFNSSPPAIRIGGAYPRTINSVSATHIVVIIDTGATGAITVSNVDGKGSLGDFTFTPSPVIYSLSNNTAAKLETITIKGRYLAGTTSITLGECPQRHLRRYRQQKSPLWWVMEKAVTWY